MRHLHANNIIHRDIKPENVVLDNNYFPCICDFSLSRFLPKSMENSLHFSLTATVGTPIYMPPELLRGENNYNSSVYVYSFAILAYEIMTKLKNHLFFC